MTTDHEQARSDPVTDGCVWCKVSPDDADPDVEFHDIGTGEQICSACLGDCRVWKRTLAFQVITSVEIPEDIRRETSKAASDAGAAVLDEHDCLGTSRPLSTSNATEGYQEHD